MTVGGTDFHISEWRLTKTARLAEVTNSGSAGQAKWKKTVVEATWSCQLPWDSENIPDTDVSLDVGDEVTIAFYCGDSTKFYSLPGITESVEVVNNVQNDVVRATVSGKANGAITDPVT